jgi:hypothetical protein
MNEIKSIAPIATTWAVPATVDPLLVTILSWPRPHGSAAEAKFRLWLDLQLPKNTQTLAMGVRYVVMPRPDGVAPTTLFSCHVDTVDAQSEGLITAAGIPQTKLLTYEEGFGIIGLDRASKVGTCLGADCGIGVWHMLKMIQAGVPGGYIFHTGEECGAIGSRAVLAAHAGILSMYDVAIAFDRPNDNEVITHQGGAECCSSKFASALSAQLNKYDIGFKYAPSSRGVFTDTKVYRGVIAECTNIGVGYYDQHGRNETQDYAHAVVLQHALEHIVWEALPVDRDPTKPDPVYASKPGGYCPPSRDLFGGKDSFWGAHHIKATPANKPKASKKSATLPPAYEPVASVFDEMKVSTLDDLVRWMETDPDDCAQSVAALMLEVGRLRADCAILKNMAGVA